jgi:hypothetical protein
LPSAEGVWTQGLRAGARRFAFTAGSRRRGRPSAVVNPYPPPETSSR